MGGGGIAEPEYDVFICHASQDKDAFVRPLAHALRRLGVRVWYDEFSFEIGDSVSRKIDQGIAGSRFGIVVVSQAFIGRPWPAHELAGLVNRSVEEDMKILPIWHGVTKPEVKRVSHSLSDKFAIDTQRVGAQDASIQILRLVRRDLYDAHPHAELEKLASGEAIAELQDQIDELRGQLAEYRCPYCDSELVNRQEAPVDPAERDWDIVESFACGFQRFGGEVRELCPADPQYPTFDDYELMLRHDPVDARHPWSCEALPLTPMARKARLQGVHGSSEGAVRNKIHASYLYHAGKLSNNAWFKIQISEDGL